jgi:hypothetical protein
VKRGRLALEIMRERLRRDGTKFDELRYELIGVDSVHGGQISDAEISIAEVRARVAGRARTFADACKVGAEIESLYTNGPAGGGGIVRSASAVLAIASTLVPRTAVAPRIDVVVA